MSSPRRTIEPSYAPEGLSRAEAARYVGVGSTTFDRLVEEGEMPPPRRFKNAERVVWLKREQDRALEELPIDGEVTSNEYAGVKL